MEKEKTVNLEELLKRHVTRPWWSWAHTRIDLKESVTKTGEHALAAMNEIRLGVVTFLLNLVTFWKQSPMNFVHALVCAGAGVIRLIACALCVAKHILTIVFYPAITLAAHRTIRRAALEKWPELRKRA